MTDKEKEIDRLEDALFALKMKDHWNQDDYALDREYRNRIYQLQEEIRCESM